MFNFPWANTFMNSLFYLLLQLKNKIVEIAFDLSINYSVKDLSLFDQLRVETIDAAIDPKNKQSLNLLRKLGIKENAKNMVVRT
ncbi:hypothetical protein CN491_04165 [Bacillus cereus]|uniref:Uncharacterized protein n=1 Tax=Bacillus cereus TaxID=1396 RepID=A0A2B2G2G6_BACCE|nr:hypothetical protein CN491_04165 [Bacillus cereus]PFP75459.1 hypothetical protein COJ95_17585 [Bacillus cereus]PGT20483.1 hypothetical protein COC96_00490 [Bacillus cereus]